MIFALILAQAGGAAQVTQTASSGFSIEAIVASAIAALATIAGGLGKAFHVMWKAHRDDLVKQSEEHRSAIEEKNKDYQDNIAAVHAASEKTQLELVKSLREDGKAFREDVRSLSDQHIKAQKDNYERTAKIAENVLSQVAGVVGRAHGSDSDSTT